MRLKCTTRDAPDWFKKFATAELSAKYLVVASSTTYIPDLRKCMLDVYNQKGITAWYNDKSDCIWIDVDLNTPDWSMRMLKYSGEKI